MNITDTHFIGLKVIEPSVFGDDRGYFFEPYNKKTFHENGITADFVQDNESMSKKDVLRGLHYQLNDMAQAKLVRVVHGEVLDVMVDLRTDSLTFGKVFTIVLSDVNKKQIFIPRGFAHGFRVLSDTCIMSYKCDNYYSKKHERGIFYDDPDLNIDWGRTGVIIADKDLLHPSLKDCETNFTL